ncbi:P-loop containing nucleoside triphosphate hydrolase protein [Zopfia rhizophila CBS 207.26]|uniref:P-loop containing nucleoside triphosphate hydrolase protein n=1 Tax=Zopfia rhizophila CBS 207.26 TaxID=1314779 RepID=A0A6A6DEW2_9PEZI|nr:P-loop containing nucleoside triphosphate hydrolase protein [Zopfia rhizophila CBS 207.26]
MNPVTSNWESKAEAETIPPLEDILADFDTKVDIITFYNHSTDPAKHNSRWSEFQDPVIEENRLRDLGKAFAIIHRQSKVEKDDIVSWVTTSIEAQSPRLRKVLDAIFSDYLSWYPDGSPYAVAPPFKPYVHRWDTFLEVSKQDVDTKTAEELQMLRRELEPRVSGYLSALERTKQTGTISFEMLWLILAPGCLMVSKKGGNIQVSSLVEVNFIPETRGQPAYYLLSLASVDWNGSYCGLKIDCEKIPEYDEAISVTKLPVYPAKFTVNWAQMKQKLLARGRKFESLLGFHTKTCSGKKYTHEIDPYRGCVKEIEKPVSGNIVVDAYAYYEVQDQVGPEMVVTARESRSEKQEKNSGRKEDIVPLTDVECILAVPRVKGFDLVGKEWCEFNVEDVEDVKWNYSPYDNLVLPEGEKELVLAFADRSQHGKQDFDDFVSDKGRGILILLCGPPGVGKTLTAEAVAQKSCVPLYTLSASELGTGPGNVEKALMKALKCCQLWNAVLLIDEADVYLEARDSTNLDRNELVAIFLSRLEYYQGLMFLTTNRVAAIDPAFRSRIDLILPYSDLDEPARRKVWVNFIEKLGPSVASISDSDFDQLAETQLNGREIKNSIKTSLVLANRDGPLRLKHLNVVLNIRKRVDSLEQRAM